MSNKISAKFGADVSEVEAKMAQATRATKAYERAVTSLDGKKGPVDMTQQLGRANGQLAKGMTLLRGGAVGAGVGVLIGQMKKWSDAAEKMGDSATEAQKSAAKWGKELEAFTSTITGAGASLLGTLAGWGRSIGDSFRDPLDRAYDEVAESSEQSAIRQEAALAKLKAAHERAAAEIPKLQEKLKGEQRETELSTLDQQGRALTELYEVEKAIAALKNAPQNAINQAKMLELLIEQEKIARKLRDVRAKISEQEAAAAQKAEQEKVKAAEQMEEAIADLLGKLDDQRQKNHEAEMKRTEKEHDAKMKAIEAEKKAMEKRTEDALGGIGLTKGEDGKLRRGNVIVSSEDAARTLADRARNAGFESQSKAGQIKGAGKVGESGQAKTREAAILEKIESYLRPTGT